MPQDASKIRLKITLTISPELYEKMRRYMEKNNYLSVPELLRDLLREKLSD